jgi:hypothetical protein
MPLAKFWSITIGAICLAVPIWRHFGTDKSLPVLADATPILLAIVGVVMSYIQPKKESHGVTTGILILAGFIGTMILSMNRISSDASHKQEVKDLGEKVDRVGAQNARSLELFIAAKNTGTLSEADRKKGIENALRNEYILKTNPIDPQILAGNALPPDDWMNNRLKEMGETWKVAGKPGTAKPPSSPLISISGIVTQLPAKAGDDAVAEVKIAVNGSTAKTINMGQLSAVYAASTSDPVAQNATEDSLWGMLQEHDKQIGFAPLELPVNNKSLAMPLKLMGVTQGQINLVDSGSFDYYFLSHVEDIKGKTLLNVCFHVNSKNQLTYCRKHNDP